jgi:hypothetical protein
MVDNHFADDSLVFVNVDQGFVEGALSCLDTFCVALGDLVNAHKMLLIYWVGFPS